MRLLSSYAQPPPKVSEEICSLRRQVVVMAEGQEQRAQSMEEEKDWSEIALPALRYIDECERTGNLTSTGGLIAHLQLDEIRAIRELQNLRDDELIDGAWS